MPYTGPEPARRPLSSDDITDGIISTADLADSAVTAAKVSSDVSQLGKNLIINGAMMVSQRGVNATILSGFDSTTSSYIADRFVASGAGTPQNRADLKHVSTGGPAGFPNFIRYDVTTAEAAVGALEYTAIQHRIEGNNVKHLKFGTASAVSLTLSFWMRSPKTGTHCVALSTNSSVLVQNQEFTVAVADTWEEHTVTFTPETSGGISETTTEGLRLIFPIICGSSYQGAAGTWSGSFFAATSNQQNLADNTANNIDITGVQLEVGSVATDFEHEDYGTTLAKCQRYFWRQTATGDDGVCMARVSTTTGAAGIIFHPVVMRTTPTLDVSNVADLSIKPRGNLNGDYEYHCGKPNHFFFSVEFYCGIWTYGRQRLRCSVRWWRY
jgi:hypothetical protein